MRKVQHGARGMTTYYPADPCASPHGIARTVRECRLEDMLTECLSYLRGVEVQQESNKVAELIQRIVRETT